MTCKLVAGTFSLAVLVGCNLTIKDDDGVSGDDTAVTDDTGTPSGGNPIAQLKTSGASEGAVTLSGVIATSALNREGDGFFIQDPGGGEWGGIYVYTPWDTSEVYIEVGDRLNVTGEVVDFYGWAEFSVGSATSIEVIGTGEATVTNVDPATVNDWEPWESQLIGVGPVTVTEGPNNYNEATLANGLRLDDLIYTYVDDYASRSGATFTNLVGPLAYSFENWKINPRTAADLEGYVEGDPPPSTTIAAIQSGDVAEYTDVYLPGVVVTSGLNANGNGFYVADAAGGEYSGIYMYVPAWEDRAAFAVGTIVDVQATYVEYEGLSELTYVTVTEVGTGAAPAPVELTEAPSDWEPYEGVEVKLVNVEITSDRNEYGEMETNYGISIDDFMFDYSAEQGATFASVTAHVTEYFNYKLNPGSQEAFVE